jgi:hypothetical protein
MQLQSGWKTIRWTRIDLVIIPIALFLTVPLWHRLINPTVYAEVICVIQDLDGSVTKGFGRSECLDNGKQTLVLQVKQNQGQIDPAI